MSIRTTALMLLFLTAPVLSSACSEGRKEDRAHAVAGGPLRIRVVHPLPNRPPPVSGGDYIMGSVGNGRASLWVDGTPVAVHPNGAFLAYLPAPSAPAAGYRLTAVLGGDTVHGVYPVARAVSSSARRASSAEGTTPTADYTGVVGDPSIHSDGEQQELVGSFTPDGPYQWFFLPGTRVLVTGQRGEWVRLRVHPDVEVWAKERDVSVVSGSTEYRLPRIGPAGIEPDTGWIDVSIPASSPPAYRAIEVADGIDLKLFGNWVEAQPTRSTPASDPWLRRLTSSHTSRGRALYRIRLSSPLYGYSVHWSAGKFVLRLRRPPKIDPRHPLRGLTIAVDPGHPPAGTVGPTGLEEHEATLAVAKRVQKRLEARGARVLMTRIDNRPVSLEERVLTAEAGDAHALVSIHADAVPNGVNPFLHNGTTTYFFRRQSIPLALAVQWAAVPRLGLRDRGVRRGNFAVVRPTWMPAVLCEGATMTIPEQEQALRTPDFQQRYADAIVAGLEHYFQALENHQDSHRSSLHP